MKKYAKEIINFVLNFYSIILLWFTKYGFQNFVFILVGIWFAFFGQWYIFWALFYYFLGRNVEATKKVWADIKKRKKIY